MFAPEEEDEEEAAPGFPALVAIARALDEICEDVVPVDCDPAVEALYVDCARKAARKFARNGRFVDMVGVRYYEMRDGVYVCEVGVESIRRAVYKVLRRNEREEDVCYVLDLLLGSPSAV